VTTSPSGPQPHPSTRTTATAMGHEQRTIDTNAAAEPAVTHDGADYRTNAEIHDRTQGQDCDRHWGQPPVLARRSPASLSQEYGDKFHAESGRRCRPITELRLLE
jgi:hypothetical protein